MKRRVLAGVMVLALVFGTGVFRITAADLRFLQSVVALTMPAPDENGIGHLAVICSASSIGERKWLTAAHCVADYTVARYYILGDEVTVVKIDAALDLAVLVTEEANRPALVIATKAPEVLDPVIVAGFPLGMKRMNVTQGVVSGFQVFEDDEAFWPYLMLAVTGAPGNSGSPVLNADREIISVVQVGFDPESFSPQMGGAMHSTLVKFLQ